VLSTSEKFEKEFYVDNEFYVSKVTEMNEKYFNGKITGKDKNNYPTYEYPFFKELFFIINDVTPLEERPYNNGHR
jgi:hypothetical protein